MFKMGLFFMFYYKLHLLLKDMNTRIILLIIIVVFALKGRGQAPNCQWAHEFSGNNNGFEVATDQLGNIYQTGIFSSDSITFGTFTLHNYHPGMCETFFVKFDPNGAVIWAKNTKGNKTCNGYYICLDHDQNVYIAGGFGSDSVSFDNVTIYNHGHYPTTDAFLAKYNSSGTILWAKSIGSNRNETTGGLCVDLNNNVCWSGTFASDSITLDFLTLHNHSTTGFTDTYLAKLNSNGNILWAKCIGGTSMDQGARVGTDNNNNVIIYGEFVSDSISFGTITVYNCIGCYNPCYIAKYDSLGNILWVRRIESSDVIYARAFCTDLYSNIFIGGEYNGNSMILDNITIYNNSVNGNSFLAKYDSTGQILWARSTGGFNSSGESICTDYNGNVLITGQFQDSITFNTNLIIHDIITNHNNWDVYIAKYDPSGNALWATNAGGNDSSTSQGICVDINNNLIVSGYFQSTFITFDTIMLQNLHPGYNDVFIVKYGNIVTSVNEMYKRENGLMVYPNPAINTITMHLKIGLRNDELRIYDLYERVLYKGILNDIDTKIDVSKWNTGIYFYEVSNEKDCVRGKFVVER